MNYDPTNGGKRFPTCDARIAEEQDMLLARILLTSSWKMESLSKLKENLRRETERFRKQCETSTQN